MSKKIVFMGTPDYATTIFETLIKSQYEVIALFTQPDKKVGRKQVLTAPHVKQFCIDNSIELPIFQPQKLRDNEEVYKELKKLSPDFIVVAAYGQILPKEILELAPCINLHASLLPKYRGASPIQESLLNDDEFTGVTSMLMDVGLDTGDILGFEYLKIQEKMEVSEAFNKLSHIATKLTLKTLDKYEYLKAKKQDDSLSSHCKKIKKDDGLVSFENSKKLYLKYKAYSFWPGIFLASGLKIKGVSLVDENSLNDKAGQIIEVLEDCIVIACLKGKIMINTIQAPSKKAINAVDYIRGQRLEVGDILL